MLQIAHLLAIADEYQRVTHVEDKTLSFWVFKDSKKLTALRGKSDITTGRLNAAVQYFADNWPEGAVWPKGTARPKASVAA